MELFAILFAIDIFYLRECENLGMKGTYMSKCSAMKRFCGRLGTEGYFVEYCNCNNNKKNEDIGVEIGALSI